MKMFDTFTLAQPSKPKNDFTWDPKDLLDYIKNLQAFLNLKQLSQKLVTHLAFITGRILQIICC